MRIDSEVIKKEADKIAKDLYKTKSLMDYRIKLSTLYVLEEAYENVVGEELEHEIPVFDFYMEKMPQYDSYLYEILGDYLINKKEHNALTGKIISTYHRSGFVECDMETATTKISRKNQLELINEFLFDLNPDIQKQFNYMHMNNLIDTEEKEYESNNTYYVFSKAKPYVLVDKCENIFDIDVLMHEIGHAYSIKKLENKSRIQMLNFSKTYYEMFSEYMELCFQDYLKKNYLYPRDAYIIENSYYSYLYYHSYALKKCEKVIENSGITCDDTLDYINQAFIYTYGEYLAMRIHEKRLNDKEGTEEALNDFLSYQGLLTYDEQLNLFGLNRDNLKDMKVLKKRLSNHEVGLRRYIKY